MRLGFVPWVAYRYSRISRCQKSRVKPCRIDRESARDRGRMLDCACGAIENAIRERGAAQSVHQQPVVSSENQGGGRSRLIYFVWRSGEQPAAACRSLTDYAILPPNKVHDELCRTKHMFTDCSRVVVFPSSCTWYVEADGSDAGIAQCPEALPDRNVSAAARQRATAGGSCKAPPSSAADTLASCKYLRACLSRGRSVE